MSKYSPSYQWFRTKFSAALSSSSGDTSLISRFCTIKYWVVRMYERKVGIEAYKITTSLFVVEKKTTININPHVSP